MRIAELANLRVAIWGLGREGHAAHTALRQRLPELPLTVFCSDAEAHFMASDHAHDRYATETPSAADLSAFDIVIKSPGISAYRPEMLEAQRNGTRFTSATALWFAEHPDSRVIAVTGTKGKSTTSALIAHLLRGLGKLTALAGNIGLPVLELLDPPIEPDWWVIELSSFQTREANRLQLAVITNIEEEHLDWHGSRERYVLDKLALAAAAERVLINATQVELRQYTVGHPQRRFFAVPESWHVDGEFIMRGQQRIFERSRLPLPGLHNAVNACAALAAIEAIGEDAVAAAEHLATFHALPHRLQTLGVRDGLSWVDDSIATTPQATIEALRSLQGQRPAHPRLARRCARRPAPLRGHVERSRHAGAQANAHRWNDPAVTRRAELRPVPRLRRTRTLLCRDGRFRCRCDWADRGAWDRLNLPSLLGEALLPDALNRSSLHRQTSADYRG